MKIDMKRHAEIAGAGFAGLVTATALRQRGWTVRVHERNHELRELGAGLFLWGNALHVLRSIGAYDDVRRGAHLAPSFDVCVGQTIRAQDATNTPGMQDMWTMTRQHLYACVLKAAIREGVDIETNSAAIGARPEGELLLADGRTLRADLVIGADGVKSAIRASIGAHEHRRMYDDGIIRVLAPRQDLTGGKWDRVVDYWSLGERNLRVLYVPCNDKTLYMAMMARKCDTAASAVPVDKALWINAFPMLEPFIRNMADSARYDVYEATSLDRWHRGRIALVGDAAHAMPPTLGQGAGFAMMNGAALAAAVSAQTDVAASLKSWEACERPVTDRTQQRAEELASMGSARVDITIADMEPSATSYVPAGI